MWYMYICCLFSGKLVFIVNSDDYEVFFLYSLIIYGCFCFCLFECCCILFDSELFLGDVVYMYEWIEI